MTEDDLIRLLADPPPDPGFVARVDALVRLDQLCAAQRRRAWRRFGQEAAGALAIAAAAALVATVPGAGWTLALLATALPAAWLAATPPGSAAAR